MHIQRSSISVHKTEATNEHYSMFQSWISGKTNLAQMQFCGTEKPKAWLSHLKEHNDWQLCVYRIFGRSKQVNGIVVVSCLICHRLLIGSEERWLKSSQMWLSQWRACLWTSPPSSPHSSLLLPSRRRTFPCTSWSTMLALHLYHKVCSCSLLSQLHQHANKL